MALAYLLDPANQYQNINGVNNVAGWFEVFISNTDERADVFLDFAGTPAPARIGIDMDGRCVMVVDDSKVYRVEMHDRNGVTRWTLYPVWPLGAGGGGGGGGTEYIAGDGINISGETISVDTSTVALKSDIPEVPVKGVEVDGSSVVNAQGVAEITLPTFTQAQANWAETDTGAASYIQNKPANLVQDAAYVHTDNNFTSTLKDKLDGIASGAEVNVQSDWTEANTSSDSYIQHKPSETTLVAGSNITFTEGTGTLTISAAGGNVPTPGSSDAGKLLTVTDANGNFAWQDSDAPVIRFKEGSGTVTYSELDQFTLGDHKSELYGRRKGDTTVTMLGLYGPYPTSSDTTGKFLKAVYGAGNNSYAEWANPEPLCDLKLLEPQTVNLNNTSGITTLSIQDEYGYDVRITSNASPTLRLATQSEDTLHTVIKVKMTDVSYCGTFTMEWYDEMLNQHGIELDLSESTQSYFFDVYVRRVYYSNAWYTIARVYDFPCAYRESPYNSTSRTNNTNWIGRWL